MTPIFRSGERTACIYFLLIDTNISIGLGNGRMIFLLEAKRQEPGTRNQEPRTKTS
jgi:hypothetical protein